MLTIKTKITLAYTIVFGFMFCLFAYFIYRSTNELEIEKIDARLESNAAKISSELSEEDDNAPTDIERLKLLQRGNLMGLRIQLLDPAGHVIVEDSILKTRAPGEIGNVFKEGEKLELLSIDNRQYRALWKPIEINEESHAILQLTLPMSDVENSLQRLRLQFLTGIPLALLLTAFAAYVITKMAFRPMMHMVDTAKSITAKNLHQRITLSGTRDEVRLLGETLNNMIERIEAAFRSQKQFVADASHEIRTPLTVICGELEFAEKRISDLSARESIQTSLSEIDRLTKLTDGLLLLAKLDASQLTLKLAPLRLDELLLECVQLINGIAAKKKIQMKVNLQDAVELNADKEKMKSVILNLLDNAVKYSNENTIVTISLSREETRSNRIFLSVEDQGPGIPQTETTNIFKRFYRVDSSRTGNAGSGIGLSIVEQLVHLHGGSVSVRSETGKGTIFTVELE